MTQYVKPSVLPAWAATGDKVQPADGEISTGWPSSLVPPSRQRMNWVLHYVANAVRYFAQRGIPQWDAAEDYPVGAKVVFGGLTYSALLGVANTNQSPDVATTFWELWGYSATQMTAILATKANLASPTFTGTVTAPTFVGALTGNASSANTATTAGTATTANNLNTANGYQINGLGVGTAPSATAGEIRATNNVTAYYSDARLKNVTRDIENALAAVCSLRGVIYTSNEVAAGFGYTSKEEQVGVLAQEVQRVLPQVVTPAPFDIGQREDGSEFSKSGEDYLTVRYERLVPLLIQAIKELKSEVDTLKRG